MSFVPLPFAEVLKVLSPASPQARSIFDLASETGIILVCIFAIVAGLIVYALMRFRWREGATDPRQVAGNLTIEIVWTAIPCAIIAVLFMLTARTMAVSDPAPAPQPDLVITGHQWWWEANYPASGVVAANEIHIPVGQPLSILLKSNDVLHEFWVPELTRKLTAVPGHPNYLWIEADKPGAYLGVCSEFCGTQHAWMHFLIVAESPTQFAAWKAAQLKIAASPSDSLPIKGLAIFQQSSCISCHAINGVAGDARIGPDLTHFASRRELGAGVVTNTPENLRRWLANPQQVKPGVKMPDFKFNDEQLAQLIAYFETLK